MDILHTKEVGLYFIRYELVLECDRNVPHRANKQQQVVEFSSPLSSQFWSKIPIYSSLIIDFKTGQFSICSVKYLVEDKPLTTIYSVHIAISTLPHQRVFSLGWKETTRPVGETCCHKAGAFTDSMKSMQTQHFLQLLHNKSPEENRAGYRHR